HILPQPEEGGHGLGRVFYQPGEIETAQRVHLVTARPDDLQPPAINILERHLTTHRRVGECPDLGDPVTRQLIDPLDGGERRVAVEDNGREAALMIVNTPMALNAPGCAEFRIVPRIHESRHTLYRHSETHRS